VNLQGGQQIMISANYPAASWFLLVSGAGFLAVYGVPLLFFPLRWARWFQWTVPGETALTVYFGRCVGVLALAIIIVSLQAVPHPEKFPVLFDLIAWTGVLMTVLHVYGAIRRVQPCTETAEILLYAALGALAVWLRAGLG
jgi:hypothetical protein